MMLGARRVLLECTLSSLVKREVPGKKRGMLRGTTNYHCLGNISSNPQNSDEVL